MRGFNHVTLRGLVVGGMELKRSQSGFVFMELNLGVMEATKSRDTDQWGEKETDIPIVFFAESAEDVANAVHLGDHVIIVGKVRVNTVSGKDGNEYPRVSIMGMSCDIIGEGGGVSPSQPEPQRSAPPAPKPTTPSKTRPSADIEDVPF